MDKFKSTPEQQARVAEENLNVLPSKSFTVENEDGSPGATVKTIGGTHDVKVVHEHLTGDTFVES